METINGGRRMPICVRLDDLIEVTCAVRPVVGNEWVTERVCGRGGGINSAMKLNSGFDDCICTRLKCAKTGNFSTPLTQQRHSPIADHLSWCQLLSAI